jgi:hypothetical protein
MVYPAWQITLELIGVFCLSVLAGYLFTKAKRLRHELQPVPGAKVRIRGPKQIYHCRLESVKASRWTFGPPLTRDNFYPMAHGEEIIAEATVGPDRLLFKTVLICGDRFRGRIWVEPPKQVYHLESKAARDLILK